MPVERPVGENSRRPAHLEQLSRHVEDVCDRHLLRFELPHLHQDEVVGALVVVGVITVPGRGVVLRHVTNERAHARDPAREVSYDCLYARIVPWLTLTGDAEGACAGAYEADRIITRGDADTGEGRLQKQVEEDAIVDRPPPRFLT